MSNDEHCDHYSLYRRGGYCINCGRAFVGNFNDAILEWYVKEKPQSLDHFGDKNGGGTHHEKTHQ
jgi:hypothetical protein